MSQYMTHVIFTWLRCGGYARHEKEIWSHGWIDIYIPSSGEDSSEDEEDEEDRGSLLVESWLSQLDDVSDDPV